jgi:hypothetical protein
MQEYAFMVAMNAVVICFLWKHFSWASEETERKLSYWTAYPYWRDPIARRNEDKYKRLIRENNVDICDPKWTGVPKTAL